MQEPYIIRTDDGQHVGFSDAPSSALAEIVLGTIDEDPNSDPRGDWLCPGFEEQYARLVLIDRGVLV